MESIWPLDLHGYTMQTIEDLDPGGSRVSSIGQGVAIRNGYVEYDSKP